MTPISDRELVITRLIDAPRAALFKAWTDPELLKQWFCPKPWTVSSAEMDVRAGGASCIVMNGPNGEVFPNRGVYLEVIENEKIVFTDAFVNAWEPSEKAFMVGTITFEDEGGKTRYHAKVQHWTVADRETHEQMGFRDGWSKATDQLEELVASLA
jgi:uncharacterized protein YndB with AHSA1/START domain